MLQLQNIRKQFTTGDLTQVALNGVSLNLRDNEFVAVLGPSGSGKTTLLNIIGGLDRYDSGDLIIGGISTRQYRDRDWDSYRNHTVGFVFQSYNLIPHQSVLANVELALTIAGVPRKERRERARRALERVGLGDQCHKRPNQMSGGQMQRVAIARALVNDPDIVLADEPTGALDSETSVQVMELLKEVARDRLVVMVTHNPELAEAYATRIVRLKDGQITDDSDPYTVDTAALEPPQHKTMGRASMSFFTSLALSFNNLRTKKARTLLTAFAGSIGIIGIALIQALSTGVNAYISDVQKDTMTSYPITIEARTLDLSGIFATGGKIEEEVDHGKDKVYSNGTGLEMASAFTSSLTENNLTAFKRYLESSEGGIYEGLRENGIIYSYDVKFGIYAYDPDRVFLNTDGKALRGGGSGMSGMMGMAAMTGMSRDANSHFTELLPGSSADSVGSAVTESYDLVYGAWPTAYNEVVLLLDKNNEVPLATLYEIGLLPSAEYKELLTKLSAGEKIEVPEHSWSYEDICAQKLYLIPACDTYEQGEDGLFTDVSSDIMALEKLAERAETLKIVGVVRPTEDAVYTLQSAAFGYTQALTQYLMRYAEESAVVRAQRDDPAKNVLSGMAFAPSDDAEKVTDAVRYLSQLGVSDKAKFAKTILPKVYAGQPELLAPMASMNEAELAAMLDTYLKAPSDEVMLSVYDAYISAGTYEENMTAFGVVDEAAPSAINLYADSFEGKDRIAEGIEAYNRTVEEKDRITYTDYVGLLMSSVTTIVDVISYVLTAFVSVSLVVSCIMIGIITYISVLERTKEIGILRAIGASRHNVSQVFNAETFIIGLCAGLIGIGLTLLLLIPINAIIHALAETTAVSAFLSVPTAVTLVVVSVLLTMLGGLIPSRKAARKDPVTALRTE